MIRKRLINSNSEAKTEDEKKSENQANLVQEEIEQNIVYGYDRKRKRKRKADSTESSSEHPEGLEKFDNDEDVAISPTGNPIVDPTKIETEELEQEIGSRNVSRPSTYRQLSLLLTCVTLLKNNLVFIECFFNHGGIYFLIPYFVILFTLGVPMAIFELSLAQFSSIPMNGMYTRMAPILGGIPYLILTLRCVYTVYIAFDPRFLLYAYKCMTTVITGNDDWIHCGDYQGVRCFDPTISCKINEWRLNGKCIANVQLDKLEKQHDYGLLTYFGFRELRLISQIPSQFYKEIISLDMMDNIVAALAFLLVAGLITYKGHRFFASVSGFFVFLPILGMLPVVILFYYDVGSAKKNFFKEMIKNNNISKIMEKSAWLNAARVSVKTVYIADGTLMALGSMADFRHNFVKDAFLLAASGASYRLLLCFGLLPIYYVGNDLLYPFAKNVYANGELVQFHAIEIFFSALPSYSIPGVSYTVLFFAYALLFGTINFAFVAYQVITFEILINFLHHLFPRLLYLKQKAVKICVIMATVTFLLALYISGLPYKKGVVGYRTELELDDYVVGLVSTSVFIQLVSVSIVYGHKRLIVNVLTMLKSHPKTYRFVERNRVVLYLMWTVLLPISCLLSIMSIIVKKYQYYHWPVVLYAAISAFPLIYMIRQIVIYRIRNQDFSALSQTHRWQPANEGHAREIDHDERASGVLS
ncbi:hypothetical protein L5515_004088 [Caenorhabditis briggsae]|uniref:Uncharacterized protein n=1 Tax=Caenorhabditis briggsae TaxID=6238 RepID=A0AAE9EL63_CAEBR|nr:hypothetical protein L5515_004088 [Caenorhabditis briggsae]